MRVVGNGDRTLFWEYIWVEDTVLILKFARLFMSSLQQVLLERDGKWMGEGLVWDLRWRLTIRENEQILLNELLVCLNRYHLDRE